MSAGPVRRCRMDNMAARCYLSDQGSCLPDGWRRSSPAVTTMRSIGPVQVALFVLAATGPALAQSGGQAAPQLYVVTASGPAAVQGRGNLDFAGVAFAVGPDTLVTAAGAIGDPARFSPRVRFAASSIPDRTITLDGPGGDAPSFTATVAPSAAGPAVALGRNEQRQALVPARLSACAGGDAQIALPGEVRIAAVPVQSGGVVTHYRLAQPAGRDGAPFLGAPVLDESGRVTGVLTDATADGRQVAVTPIAAIAHLVPPATPIACDPRVSAGDLARLRVEADQLLDRIKAAEDQLAAQSVQIENTGQAMNVVISGLADVADVLPVLNRDGANPQDLGPTLERLSEKFRPARPLVSTVTSISTILQRPAWATKAKVADGKLTLTFAYRMQLPGPAFSPTLRVCTRIVTPYQGGRESDQYFRTTRFYAAAVATDPGLLVRCKEVWVNVPDRDGPSEWGEYRAELYLSDFEHEFRQYSRDRNWIGPDYDWNRVIFVALVKPDANPPGQGGGPDPQGGMVIQRVMIRLPDDTGDGAGKTLPVECVTFDSDQKVIDFLANKRPPVSPPDLSSTGFDDISGLELDPANASDECVVSSAL